MTEALFDLPAHLRQRLIAALDTGLLSPPYSAAALSSILGASEECGGITGALHELEEMGVSRRGAAAWVQTLDSLSSRKSLPDLVWSGPEVSGLHARDTRRVYEELLGAANRSVWVSTYAFFQGPKAFEALALRMDAKPDLRVTLLLNVQRGRGDTTKAEHIVNKFADHFWETEWPGSSHPSVYYDPRSLDLEGPGGVLHAKAVIADEESVFVTSANLTEAALDRNIEVGLLVRDRSLAATLTGHFRELIDRKSLILLPGAR